MLQGINVLFPSTVTVSTGPAFKDTNCTHNVDVEVHLIPPGTYLPFSYSRISLQD